MPRSYGAAAWAAKAEHWATMRRLRLGALEADARRREDAARAAAYRRRAAVQRSMSRSRSHNDPVFLAWVTREAEILRARNAARQEREAARSGGYRGYGEISRARCSCGCEDGDGR